MEEIVSGFFRAIGYILAEVFFYTICYWVGWPICKIFTLGTYPKSFDTGFSAERNYGRGMCSSVGLLTLVFVFYYVVLSINK
ncbi:hypothetical protein GCM10027050_14220 [Psychrosphaera aestuarii]